MRVQKGRLTLILSPRLRGEGGAVRHQRGPWVLRVLKFDGPLARGLWYRHWTRLRREGSEGSKGSEGSEGVVSPYRAMNFIVSVACLPSRPAVILSDSEESWYAEQLNQMLLNTGRREGCRLAVRPALRIIPACHVVHPLPLRGIPLKGTQDVTGLPPCPTGHSE